MKYMFLFLILIVCWVLPLPSLKILVAIVIYQSSCPQAWCHEGNFLHSSPDDVRYAISDGPCEDSLLIGRKGVGDDVLDTHPKVP